MFAGCSLDDRWMFAGCSLDDRWMIAGCSLDDRFDAYSASLELISGVSNPKGANRRPVIRIYYCNGIATKLQRNCNGIATKFVILYYIILYYIFFVFILFNIGEA